MQSRYKRLGLLAMGIAGCLTLVMTVPGGQQPTSTTAPASAAYRAPRTKDGKPDLNGIWQAMNSANWDLAPHMAKPGPIMIGAAIGALAATPPGFGVIDGNELPYLPQALAQKKENFEKRFTEDPEAKCYLPGVPRMMYMPYPFQIIQGTDHIAMVSE